MVIRPRPFIKHAEEVKDNGLIAQQTGLKNLKSFPNRPSNEFRQPLIQSQKSNPTRARRPDVVIEEDDGNVDDVIDLGAPRSLNHCGTQSPSFAPRRRARRSYVPNPRLYPGLQSNPKPKRVESRSAAGRSRRRKQVLRRPVPNSRLYRPAPPRPPPPPLQPRACWPAPQPARALDTASRVALRLGEQRRLSRAPPLHRPAPRLHSSALRQHSPAPRHRSPAPRHSSPAPRHSSPAPRQRSPAPRQRSPAPRLHSPAPRLRSLAPKIQQRPEPSTPNRRLVVTLPQAAGGDSPNPEKVVRYRPTSAHFKARDSSYSESGGSTPPAARISSRYNNTMDTASRHSTTPEDRSEGNDTQSAPSEFLAEFLSAIMRRQYAEALKYCRLILQYEPQNATARGFYPLLRHKVQEHRKKEAAAEGCMAAGVSEAEGEGGSSKAASSRQSPARVELSPEPAPGAFRTRHDSSDASVSASSPLAPQAMDQEADSPDSDADDVDEQSVGSIASQSSLELDSSEVMQSSPSFSLSRHTDSVCWESTGSASRSDADDNGNGPAPASTDNTASNAIHPGDLENDNAAGEPVHVNKKSTESLRRLREQFACSIK